MENQELFDIWKQQVEEIEPKTQLDCLRIIELNLSNVCNLKCPFCPQSLDWKKKDPRFMDIRVAKEIAKQLKEIDFKGYICTAGFGEPALNPDFEEIINCFKGFNIVLVSNGLYGAPEMWERLSKFSQIKISVHYWDELYWYKDKFKNTNAWFRNHDIVSPQMNIYNRAGALGKGEKVFRPCHLPYYKIFIDTDGTYLRCEADWSRKSNRGHNIFNVSIENYFAKHLEQDRILMSQGIEYRQNFESCEYCDINGTMTGKKFVDFWKEKGKND